MPRVGFEPRISEFQRAKTFHALQREATVIGCGCRVFPFCTDYLVTLTTYLDYWMTDE
jgi:hypothetical protein